MRTRILILLLAILSISARAQGVIKEGFQTDSYPEVSFVWHEYNPAILDNTDFRYFREDGNDLDFTVKHIPAPTDSTEDRHIVFLWEDLAYHGANMYNFSKSSLKEFFTDYSFRPQDKVNISVFSRRSLNEDSYLQDLTGGFLSNRKAVLKSIDSHQRNTREYREFPNRTDIFPAICEALENLQKIDGGVKSVIVLTAGYPLDNSSSSSDLNARLLAEKYHIPVYILQFGRDHGYSEKLSSFAPATYGTFACFHSIDQRDNISRAAAHLEGIFDSLSETYHGQDYRITFTSEGRRGSQARLLEFNIGGYEYKEQLVPPAFSLAVFIKEHVLLSCLIAIAIIGLVALAVVLIVRSGRKHRERYAELERNSDRMRADAMNEIASMKDSLRRQKESEDLAKSKVREDQLVMMMKKRNLSIRLVCVTGGRTVNFTVDSIRTSIGRDSSNDLILQDQRASRHHATIEYDGTGFKLTDIGSKNGTIVNGNIVRGPIYLNNGDKINIGSTLITVYI